MALGSPDVGSSSNWFSQYETDINTILQRIYDNTSNDIDAKDIRDAIWTLHTNTQILASQSITQSTNLYSLGTPSTITLGGVEKGSTFSNSTFQSIFNELLLPYVEPSLVLFIATPSTYQFGQVSPLSLNYTYNVGSSAFSVINFVSPNLPISSDTGPFTNDTYSKTIGSIVTTFSTSQQISQKITFTMSLVTSDLKTFTYSTGLTYLHKLYWGKLIIPTGFTPSDPSSVSSVRTFISDAVIKGLSSSSLSTTCFMQDTITFSNEYFVFAHPSIIGFPYPEGFYVDNIFSQNFTKVRTSGTFSNEYSYLTPYDVWVSDVPLYEKLNISTFPSSFISLNNNRELILDGIKEDDEYIYIIVNGKEKRLKID